jgi:hypothetical protein
MFRQVRVGRPLVETGKGIRSWYVVWDAGPGFQLIGLLEVRLADRSIVLANVSRSRRSNREKRLVEGSVVSRFPRLEITRLVHRSIGVSEE